MTTGRFLDQGLWEDLGIHPGLRLTIGAVEPFADDDLEAPGSKPFAGG